MQKLATQELSIEELTAEAMQLLTIDLEQLYVVLGCQLMGATRPARVAGLLSHQTALKNLMQPQEGCLLFSRAEIVERGKSFRFIYEDLKRDGICFLAAVKEELSKEFCTEETIALLDEISSSSMQIIVLIVAAILKLPQQIEAVSATVAAIVCKSGLRELYA